MERDNDHLVSDQAWLKRWRAQHGQLAGNWLLTVVLVLAAIVLLWVIFTHVGAH
jgi:hypothetical protein